MFLTFVLFFVTAFFSYVELFIGISKKQSKNVLYALFFVFFCMAFLRWEYGSDWEGYYTHYELYTWDSLGEHEFVYTFILVLAKSIIDDYTFVLFCFASVLFYFQTKGVCKLSFLPLTTLFVLTGTYFCNVGFVRQNIAMAILLYSLIFIIQRKLFPFAVCILLSFGFHYSALAFIPAYWLYNLKISRKKLIIIILISVFLSSLMTFFLQGVGDLLGMSAITDRVESYIDQGNDFDTNNKIDPRQMIIKACLNRGLYLLMGLYLVGKAHEFRSFYSGLFNLYCFGTVLFFLDRKSVV